MVTGWLKKKFKLTVIFSGWGQKMEVEDGSFVGPAFESFAVVVLLTLGKVVTCLRLVLNLYPKTALKLTMCLG